MGSYWYTYSPAGMQGGVFDVIWSVTKAAVNAVVPFGGALTAGAEALVDAVVPGTTDTVKQIGKVAATATGTVEELPVENPVERIDIPNFLSWPMVMQGTQQINFNAAAAYSRDSLGPFTPVEGRLKSKVEQAIRSYMSSHGQSLPIYGYGHLVSIRNRAGGQVPIGFTTPAGSWAAFNEEMAWSVLEPVTETRRKLSEAARRIAQTYGPGRGSTIMSIEEPRGVFEPHAPREEVDTGLLAAGGGGLLLLVGLGVGGYYLLRKKKR